MGRAWGSVLEANLYNTLSWRMFRVLKNTSSEWRRDKMMRHDSKVNLCRLLTYGDWDCLCSKLHQLTITEITVITIIIPFTDLCKENDFIIQRSNIDTRAGIAATSLAAAAVGMNAYCLTSCIVYNWRTRVSSLLPLKLEEAHILVVENSNKR
mmetsp:Transcript_13738/g.23383  ORF Transcript_13738/g.23383 Transcript_13738/m.23383 type:complete len:153 (-) Transcript_13738:1427-1885(-)